MAEEIYEMLDEYFQENVEKIQNSNKNLNNEQLLELYGLYKQSIIGNNNTNNDFKTLKDKKMWESWNKFYDIEKNRAKQTFIQKVYEFLN
tara:strand:- start:817 stop:1086 length:270 start_codon:yes stop_codon:yes gene_type:complete